MTTFLKQITAFQTQMDAFPATFEDADVEALDILLNHLDPFMQKLQKEIPSDFDGNAFNRFTKTLASLYERMGSYEKILIAKGGSDQKQTGAVTTYQKRMGAK